jgi:hypothetical protein
MFAKFASQVVKNAHLEYVLDVGMAFMSILLVHVSAVIHLVLLALEQEQHVKVAGLQIH